MSNCVVENKTILASLSPVARNIASHDVSAKVDSNLFANMVNDAVNSGVKTKQEYIEYLRPYEEEILKIREANGEKVKTKAGKWLYTKVSLNPDGTKPTSSYRVNKAVIGKALDTGVPLLGTEDKPLPKDVIEKSYKNVLEEQKDASPWQDGVKAAAKLSMLWEKLSKQEQEDLRTYLEDLWK